MCVCVYSCCVAHTPKRVDAILFQAYLYLFFGWCGYNFFSLVYTGSVLCTENVDLSDVLLSVSFPTSVHIGTAIVSTAV